LNAADYFDRSKRVGSREQWATYLAFLSTGALIAAWAPLVPFAKFRLGIDEGELGVLLLFLGGGSLVAMPLTGLLTARFGCRLIIICGTLVTAAVLPFLAVGTSFTGMAVALAVFGGAIGTIDVAMNVQAVIVEKRMGLSLMSRFHACYSIGGFIGAGGISALLKLGYSSLQASLALGLLMVAAVSSRAMGFIPYANDGGKITPLFAVPRPLVLFIGLFTALVFMAEGAVLDWSGVFLLQYRGAETYAAGYGYAAFAVAITAGRLVGDRLVDAVGGRRVVLGGGLISAIGFAVALALPSQLFTLFGFMLVGFGAANIVPLMFKAAGLQTLMPATLAIAAVTTLGYGGYMLGPALIGFVAHFLDLRVAFSMLAATMVFVAFAGRMVLADR
jgi:predicted MFS family arabinose efflux permease